MRRVFVCGRGDRPSIPRASICTNDGTPHGRFSRGWDADVIQTEEYFHQFAFPHPCVRELSLYDVVPSEAAPGPEAERLIAVAVMDETPSALSAIYTSTTLNTLGFRWNGHDLAPAFACAFGAEALALSRLPSPPAPVLGVQEELSPSRTAHGPTGYE